MEKNKTTNKNNKNNNKTIVLTNLKYMYLLGRIYASYLAWGKEHRK